MNRQSPYIPWNSGRDTCMGSCSPQYVASAAKYSSSSSPSSRAIEGLAATHWNPPPSSFGPRPDLSFQCETRRILCAHDKERPFPKLIPCYLYIFLALIRNPPGAGAPAFVASSVSSPVAGHTPPPPPPTALFDFCYRSTRRHSFIIDIALAWRHQKTILGRADTHAFCCQTSAHSPPGHTHSLA